MVEDLDKVIKTGMLLQEIRGGGLGGFFFQSEMHAFVTAILLGMTVAFILRTRRTATEGSSFVGCVPLIAAQAADFGRFAAMCVALALSDNRTKVWCSHYSILRLRLIATAGHRLRNPASWLHINRIET